MARDQQLIKERNEQILEDFNKWAKTAKHPKVYAKLRKKYFLTDRTLDEIIIYDNKPKKQTVDPNQMTIFNIAGV